MCGICYYLLTGDVDEQRAVEMFNKIQHRGPDATNHLILDNQFLGCHRLAIINLSQSGIQPYESDGTTLICNGQIYNYQQLAKDYHINSGELRSDVEIILSMYNKGVSIKEICQLLDGDFAFVLYDNNKKSLAIGRDRVGVRPLFWSRLDDKVMAISSEVKALVGCKGKIDRFPPCSYYQTGTELQSYCKSLQTINVSPCDAREKIYILLEQAVRKRIDSSERPVAFLCSGGLDSSIVFGMARKILLEQKRDLHVFSMQFSEGKSFDAFYAQMLVNQFQSNDQSKIYYTPVKFTVDDVSSIIDKMPKILESYDPNTIRASIPMYLLAKYLRSETEFKVFLSGEGADELFMGYNYFDRVPNGELANKESNRLLNNIHMFDVLRADRCFGQWGLELRVPYLDRDLLDFVGELPGEWKMFSNGLEKALLRHSVRELIPELVYSRIIDRQKERFSDGCGFNYVPYLLNFIHGGPGTLPDREQSERTYYLKLFRKHYINLEHLITTRELPDWVSRKIANNLLVN